MPDIDALDVAILRELQEDARLTTRELGERLHRSHSSIQSRIQRLREEGFIQKYTVVLNPEKLDLGFMAFTFVKLKDHSEAGLNHFAREIIQFPEVLECHHLAGGFDFMLRIVARDHREYHEVLMKKLFATLGVGRVKTKMVMKTAKSETGLHIRAVG